MERRLAGAVTAGGVAGAVAGSTISNRKPTRNTATKDSRGNTSTSSMGQRAGSKVGAVLDTKNKVTDRLCGVFRKGKGKVQRVRLQAWHGAGTAIQTDGTFGKAGTA